MLEKIGSILASFLTKEISKKLSHNIYYQVSLDEIKPILRPCDVILIEGKSRVSKAIQFITESNWSHAAIFIGKYKNFENCLIEVKLVDGCTYTDINYYSNYNIRVCRPMFLSSLAKRDMLNFFKNKIGVTYDLRNIFDLCRFAYPNPPIPKKYRRNLIGIGAGTPTKAICSTLIARGFEKANHPILPLQEISEKRNLVKRHHSFCLPKDFDISPFFEIIKPRPKKTF